MKTFYKDKRVLVTGASGFVGTHLINKLKELGAFVGVTKHINKVVGNHDIEYLCNLQSIEQTYEAVTFFEPDLVFHLASQAIVEQGDASSYDTINTNVLGTVNLLTTLKGYSYGSPNLHGVIVASTDKVYGRHKHLPYQEDFALLGTKQIYEASKNCEDVLSQAYSYTFGLPIAITRFGNVYGPGDTHLSRIIPGTIVSYMKKEAPFIRSNGQHYRDFIYIDDVVSGYLKLGAFRSNFVTHEPMIYNFGTGIPCRILDVVGMIASNFTGSASPVINYGAEDEIKQQYVDSSKARRDLDWKSNTPLREGIPATVDWYMENYDFSN